MSDREPGRGHRRAEFRLLVVSEEGIAAVVDNLPEGRGAWAAGLVKLLLATTATVAPWVDVAHLSDLETTY